MKAAAPINPASPASTYDSRASASNSAFRRSISGFVTDQAPKQQ
jgi:hypothetical protein